MTALGLYHDGRVVPLFVAFIDQDLVRAEFGRKIGSVPTRIILVQNGKLDPQVVRVIDIKGP